MLGNQERGLANDAGHYSICRYLTLIFWCKGGRYKAQNHIDLFPANLMRVKTEKDVYTVAFTIYDNMTE